jgi:hypothetical protein
LSSCPRVDFRKNVAVNFLSKKRDFTWKMSRWPCIPFLVLGNRTSFSLTSTSVRFWAPTWTLEGVTV